MHTILNMFENHTRLELIILFFSEIVHLKITLKYFSVKHKEIQRYSLLLKVSYIKSLDFIN